MLTDKQYSIGAQDKHKEDNKKISYKGKRKNG